uniref:Secretogranin-1 n=1 Tax=Nannospalax galili TaxID=1026970 RepID=A0A8C6RBB2_NANGA
TYAYIFIIGGKEVKDEEKSENENKKFEVRLRDPADASLARRPASKEEARATGEDTQGQAKADTEQWTEGGHSREGAGGPQERLHPFDRQVSKRAKALPSERDKGEEREGEEGDKDPKAGHREYAGEEKHFEEPGEKQNGFPNKRNQGAAKEESVARADAHSAGLSEQTHSREHSSQESGEETGSQKQHPLELSKGAQSQEDSEESEEDAAFEVDKRTRPSPHHGRIWLDRSSQEEHPLTEGRGRALDGSKDTDVGTASLGEKRGHHSTHYRASAEAPDYGEEVRSYPGFQAPETLEGPQYGVRGREEDRPSQQSEESLEEEYKRNRPSTEPENTENRYGEESQGERGREGTKGHHHRGKGGELGDTREEKRLLGEGHYRVHGSQMDQAKGHPQSKWQDQERSYFSYSEEGGQGKWQPQQEHLLDPEDSRKEVGLQGRQYAPYRTPERRKRLGVLFNPYFDPLQWKNSDFQKKDSVDDSFLEGEDENRLTLAEKNFFPKYNHDWWERRPFSDDVNWGFEKRSFARAPELDLKGQYDGVAELDQLLHYKKKSAEFPDFYDSEEQMGPRQEAESGKDRANQRVLTEEEEKELENLAAMDLELQKIAEKFGQTG